jgi:hypothetical protein
VGGALTLAVSNHNSDVGQQQGSNKQYPTQDGIFENHKGHDTSEKAGCAGSH